MKFTTCGFFALLLPALLLASCSDTNKPPYTLFTTEKKVNAQKIAENFSVYNPDQIELVDTTLFVVDYYTSRNLVKAYDLAKNKEYAAFCRKGLDSNEFLPPVGISADPRHHALDIYGRRDHKFVAYPLADVATDHTLQLPWTKVNAGAALTCLSMDGYYLANGLYNRNRVGKFDSHGQFTGNALRFPDAAKGLNEEELFLSYQGAMIADPSRQHVVLAAAFCDDLTFTDIRQGGPVEIKNYRTRTPDFQYFMIGSQKEYRAVPKNKRGYLDIKGSDRYVYALYSGASVDKYDKGKYLLSDWVFVFDWQGKPVNKLHLDKPVRYIAVDRYDHYLIGMSFEPAPTFYKFAIDQP